MQAICPYCGSSRTITKNHGRKTGSVVGIVLGTVAGGLLGALLGGAAGYATSAAVGQVVDEHVLDNHQCLECDLSFSLPPARSLRPTPSS